MSVIVKTRSVVFGGKNPFVLIAGPCVIESEKDTIYHAREIKRICSSLAIPFVFKASYDKANRSSLDSYRGPGIEKGLSILKKVRNQLKIPVVSDVHSVDEIKAAACVLDIIQIPAFLSRQTDLLTAAGKTGKIVNIKKGQFLSPRDMKNAVNKVRATGNKKILLTERGTMFGYNNLVSDFRSIPLMKKIGIPVVFDATHSVQIPGGLGTASGGNREFIPLLARCGIVSGVDALFLEVHKNPARAKCDGPNSLKLSNLRELLKELIKIKKALKKK
ncbi:3-deoxy-8-phosphooctulonate synthase [Candidatus Omnitrophota bacterium]